MTLRLLGPHIMVRPDVLPEVGTSGLVLVHGRRQSTISGTVVAVGTGAEFVNRAVVAALDAVSTVLEARGLDPAAILDDTVLEPREHLVAVGDRVLFAPDSGEELTFEGDLLVSILEDQVLAVIEESHPHV